MRKKNGFMKLIAMLTIVIFAFAIILTSCDNPTGRSEYSFPFIAKAVSAGLNHTVAIDVHGLLWTWGSKGYSIFQDNGSTWYYIQNYSTPVVIAHPNGKLWASISAGGDYTVAIDEVGSLWAWGRNHIGQLGDGTLNNRYEPVQIGIGNNWASVSAGTSHVIAIDTDNALWAWGSNGIGELGDGTNGFENSRHSPIQIEPGTRWASVSAGSQSSLAIRTDNYHPLATLNGTLWVWGVRTPGMINGWSNTPHLIHHTTTWTAIYAGMEHSMAIREDGSLWAWGNNGEGQLGDGTNGFENYRSTLVQVGTDNDWLSISAGERHTVAIKADGSLWAWGSNRNGQLGDGTITPQRNTPIRIGTDDDWFYVSAGRFSTVAMRTDGSVWAWGNNQLGQLGDGTRTNRLSPVRVMITP